MNNRLNHEFIQKQKIIRILFDDAEGFGDLVQSQNAMKELRERGFTGYFSAIYPDRSAAKIATLFDLPETPAAIFRDDTQKIIFMNLSEFLTRQKDNRIEPVTLAISGALYTETQSLIANQYDIYYLNELPVDKTKYQNAMIIFKKPASQEYHFEAYFIDGNAGTNRLNDNVFFPALDYIEPNGDKPLNASVTKTLIYYFDLNIIVTEVLQTETFLSLPPLIKTMQGSVSFRNHSSETISSEKTFTHVHRETLAEAKQYLDNDVHGHAVLKNKPSLPAYIDLMEQGQFNVLPVYGWTVTKTYNERYDHDSTPANILQIIAGARAAQLSGGEFGKPLVISVYYDYEVEEKQILEAIDKDNRGELETPGSDNARKVLTSLGLRGDQVLQVASLANPDTQSLLQNLKCNQILVLSMGPFPSVVFNGLYAHTAKNIWPQIREGVGSFNTLITTGRPHFRCGYADSMTRWELGYEDVNDANLKESLKHFYEDQPAFCNNMHTWDKNPEMYLQLTDFILQAADESSALSTYFSQLQKEATDAEHDRLEIGIQKAVAVLTEQEPASLCDRLFAWVSQSKATTALQNLGSHYATYLCETIRECETYFPNNQPNLWCGNASPAFFANHQDSSAAIHPIAPPSMLGRSQV